MVRKQGGAVVPTQETPPVSCVNARPDGSSIPLETPACDSSAQTAPISPSSSAAMADVAPIVLGSGATGNQLQASNPTAFLARCVTSSQPRSNHRGVVCCRMRNPANPARASPFRHQGCPAPAPPSNLSRASRPPVLIRSAGPSFPMVSDIPTTGGTDSIPAIHRYPETKSAADELDAIRQDELRGMDEWAAAECRRKGRYVVTDVWDETS